ncbi:hypothetical protein KBC99_00040 [Candidatus Saccharibacteria bacterium]|nr:hypothetical protein [Candidatus Saccharibacteria bacterium]
MTPTELYDHISEAEGIPMQELNPLQYELLQIAEDANGLREKRYAEKPQDIREIEDIVEVKKRIDEYERTAMRVAGQIDDITTREQAYFTIVQKLAEMGETEQAKEVVSKIQLAVKNFSSVLEIAKNDPDAYSMDYIEELYFSLVSRVDSLENAPNKMADY